MAAENQSDHPGAGDPRPGRTVHAWPKLTDEQRQAQPRPYTVDIEGGEKVDPEAGRQGQVYQALLALEQSAWPCGEFSAASTWAAARDDLVSVIAWRIDNLTVGVTVVTLIDTEAGKVLHVDAAAFAPGRWAKAVTPQLVDMAKRHGCIGWRCVSARPMDRLTGRLEPVATLYAERF